MDKRRVHAINVDRSKSICGVKTPCYWSTNHLNINCDRCKKVLNENKKSAQLNFNL